MRLTTRRGRVGSCCVGLRGKRSVELMDGQEKVSLVWSKVGPAGQDIEGTTECSQVREQPTKLIL